MRSKKLLEAIVSTAIDGIITIDRNGIIDTVNPSALDIFGYKKNELIGQNISILMPEPYRSKHDDFIQAYLRTGQAKIIGKGREVEGLKKDGTIFSFRLAVSKVELDDQIIFAGFVHDLTKEKIAKKQIRHYTEELERKVKERTKDLVNIVGELEDTKREVSLSLEKEKELNKMKSHFVSMASHEFRTPLSSVQLSATLIEKYLKKSDHEGVLKHVDRIKNSVNLLSSILSDFLSLEQLEAGAVQTNLQDINLVKLAEEVTEEMQMICKKNQHIVYEHTGAKGNFFLDANLIKNSVINLISNSIKFSGENSFIEFNTKIKDDTCSITVKDNGIGIPETDQKNLFEPFFRANNTESIPGTGLGLNIVRRYVRLMGGKVQFESEVNNGTNITLIFNKNQDKNSYGR
ncbi:MAG TPA: PAS domain-containing sensor histidine kinase [Sphingobacterium sp.]|nr:PAS domain-containing sensor histidine kinase [Sphingobacterium sp.]